MYNSTNFNARHFVIDLGVKHENTVNTILSLILSIDPKKSRSFGTSSQALSFNAKVNLLLDLNYLGREQVEKFKIFMEVRNKFAHLLEVDTFEKCFELTKNYTAVKKLIDGDFLSSSREEEMIKRFSSLSIDISNSLNDISCRIIDRSKRLIDISNKIKNGTFTIKETYDLLRLLTNKM